MTDRLITADASKVSGAAFLDAILGITHEQRAEQRQQDIDRCIRAIQRGDVYGWPVVFVAECRRLMETRKGPVPQYDCRVSAASDWYQKRCAELLASADTHPKDGDVQQAPLVSGAVPKADAQ